MGVTLTPDLITEGGKVPNIRLMSIVQYIVNTACHMFHPTGKCSNFCILDGASNWSLFAIKADAPL